MNKLKTGILLIILGNVLYIIYTFLTKTGASNFGDFSSGLLLGLSIGSNLVGIILTVAYSAKEEEHKKD